MKRFFLIVLSLFLCMPCMVNAVELEDDWFVSLNGNDLDELVDVAITKENNYVVVGYSRSTDLSGISNMGNRDVVIAMYDESGKQLFLNGFGTSDADYVYNVIVSSDNYLYVVGRAYNIPLILKFDMSGNLVKSKIISDYYGSFYSLIEDKNGDFYTVGYQNYDGVIVKFDKDLNIISESVFGGSGRDVIYNIYSMSDGSLIINGYTKSHDIKGFENDSFDQSAIFVANVDPEGNIKWINYCSEDVSDGYVYFRGTKTSDNGVVIVLGGPVFTDESYSMIMKYDINGNLLWQRKIDGNGCDHLPTAYELSDGSILVSGYTKSTDLDLKVSVSSYDGLLVLYNKDGDLKWMKNYEPGDYFAFVSPEVDKNGDLVYVGHYIPKIESNSGVELESYLMKFKINYEIKKNESSNGSYDVIQNGDKATITVTPDEGYIVDDVVVKDSQDKNVDVTEVEKNKYEFIITDDVTIDVTFERDYKITLKVGDNGSATSEKLEDNNGRIKVVPDEGYEVDEVIIKDSTGKVLVYEEKDGIYNFKLTDDVTVTVTFKEGQREVVKGEEENPKTADAFIYYACAIVCSLFGVWSVEQYRKTRRVS